MRLRSVGTVAAALSAAGSLFNSAVHFGLHDRQGGTFWATFAAANLTFLALRRWGRLLGY